MFMLHWTIEQREYY